jgi:hypothetical protein
VGVGASWCLGEQSRCVAAPGQAPRGARAGQLRTVTARLLPPVPAGLRACTSQPLRPFVLAWPPAPTPPPSVGRYENLLPKRVFGGPARWAPPASPARAAAASGVGAVGGARRPAGAAAPLQGAADAGAPPNAGGPAGGSTLPWEAALSSGIARAQEAASRAPGWGDGSRGPGHDKDNSVRPPPPPPRTHTHARTRAAPWKGAEGLAALPLLLCAC